MWWRKEPENIIGKTVRLRKEEERRKKDNSPREIKVTLPSKNQMAKSIKSSLIITLILVVPLVLVIIGVGSSPSKVSEVCKEDYIDSFGYEDCSAEDRFAPEVCYSKFGPEYC